MKENLYERCKRCNYDISCGYDDPVCALAQKEVFYLDRCPLDKNKNDSTEETAKEKKEDVESSNED